MVFPEQFQLASFSLSVCVQKSFGRDTLCSLVAQRPVVDLAEFREMDKRLVQVHVHTELHISFLFQGGGR